ncbi:MAG: AsmA family protein [Rhodobiaceae bacterium]|nr:AsmA family protein [Rhodobiaceae bacterium]
MNSVLSYIAGFVILILFAALVGPSIVDWNTFRAEIESQISEAVGRDVTIGGDINFVILPAPRFSLGDLSIGGDDAEAPLAQVGTLEGEVALAPLLRAEIDVVRVRALDFTAHVRRDENGSLNWANNGTPTLDTTFDPEAISLESMVFENGRVLLSNAVSDGAVQLLNVTGELAATSLVGPLKFDGRFNYEDSPYELAFSMGAFGGDRAFPVNIDLTSTDHNWTGSFSGLSTEATISARLDGTFEFRFGQSEVDGEVLPFLQLTSGFVGDSEAISLREVELSLGSAIFKGGVEVGFEEGPNITAGLSGSRLVVDRVLEQLQVSGIPPENLKIPESITGALELDVADVSLGGAHASNVQSDVRLEDGTLFFDLLSVELPGDTTAQLKGTFSLLQGTPRFDGSLEAVVDDASMLARWAADLAQSEPLAPGVVARESWPLRLQTELAMQPSLLQAYSLTFGAGEEGEEDKSVTGGLSFALRGRPAFSVELRGSSVDLSWLDGLLNAQSLSESLDTSSFDANAILGFDRLVLADSVLSDVDVSAALSDGVLSVDRFEATLNGTDKVSATGTVSEIGPFATGGLEGSIHAGLATSIASMLLDAEIPSADEGVLTYVIRGEQTEEGHKTSLDLSGEVDSSVVSLVVNQKRVRSSPSADKLDLVLTLENPSAHSLLDQFGVAPTSVFEGAGRVRMQLSGQPEGSLDTSFRFAAGDVEGSFTGKTEELMQVPRFDGRFESSAPSFGLASQAAGWQGGVVDLISANARDGAFVAGGDLVWSTDRFAVSEVEAIAGAFRVSGGGAVEFESGIPLVDANISLGSINLDSLFSSGADDPWSADPLDWSSLGRVKGSLTLAVSKATIGNLMLEDVAAKGTLADGVLSFTPVTAEMASGRLTMGARFEGGEGVPGLGLTLAAEDISVDQAAEMFSGERLASGEATASLQVEGQGRSLLGLVSTLSGKGSLALTDGELNGFDLEAFRTALEGLSTMDDFDAVVAVHLDKGRAPYNRIEGTFSVEDGILKYAPTEVEVAGANGLEVVALADLVRLEADVETDVTLTGERPLPPMTMVLAGPLQKLERRTDSLAIQQAVSQRLLVQDIEDAGIEDLPDELRELIVGPDSGSELDVPLEGVIEDATPGEAHDPTAPTPVERPTN